MASSLQQQPQPRRSTMEHRSPHRTPRADRGSHLTTTTTTVYSGEKSVKMNEKEMLHGLNDRFAGFIEKVRGLERQNHLLESEIREMKEMKPPSLEEEHGAELGELRKLLREITHQKHQIETEHQNLEEELSRLRAKYEKEAHGRSDAESSIVMLKKDIGDAYQAKVQLEKKAQCLVDEIDFLKKNHEAEVSRLIARVQEAQVNVRAAAHGVDFGKADLTAALRDIRAQLEGHAASDLQLVDETFRARFAELTEAAESKREALKASQQEIQECRRRLQAKSIELDCNRGTRDALERQLRDVEDHHNEDIFHYQDTMKELENELISAKFDMSAHLREYQDLLNVKMELDVEILSYRKLLEGEETRLCTVSGAPAVSMPYIYRQSPVYTLPCIGRQSGPGRRAEPQYKFVEEIITETTREIEMSEFEETGSEETVDGDGAEEGCDKAGRESSGGEEEEEAEADDNQGDKHGSDRDGEQASDSQQDLVESAGRSEQGDDDEVEEGSSTAEGGGETADKTEAESQGPEAAESAENSDRPTAESAHSKEIRPTEDTGMPAENEPCDSVANASGQRGSDAVPTVQKDEDSKIEESEEVKMTESEVDNKVSALKESEEADVKDNIDTAQAQMLKDESSAKDSTDSDSVQESSIVGKLQGEAPSSVPTETMEKVTDLTVALSVPLPKDAVQPEEQNKETPSVVPKGEEKEDRITESLALNNADTVKSDIGHEVPKSIENTTDDADKEKDKSLSVKSETPKLEDEKPNTGDNTQTLTQEKIAVTTETKDPQQSDSSKTKEPTNAIDDTDLEKDKRTAATSDMTEPPKLDGERSVSGDKTQTVEPMVPKEKIAVTVENKDSQHGAPDSSKTQEPSNAIDDTDLEKGKRTAAKSDMTEPPKLEDEMPNTGDNAQTVGATLPKEKIAVTAESKDPQQGAPDSSKTQKPSSDKLEDEKPDRQGKKQAVESISPKEKMAVTEESKDSQPRSSKTQEPSNTIDDTDLEKDKNTAAKSDVREPRKLDSEKSISGDKTILPKEKIAVTVENKDSQQGVPDSSKTPEPSNAIDDADLEKVKRTAAESDTNEPPEPEGEKSISGDNTQSVEPIFPMEKIAVTVENKDAQQPDSKSQELSKVPEKINNAKEKEEKLKDSVKNNDLGKTTETKTPSQKEPGISTVSLTSKAADGLMSEAVKPKTKDDFSNGIGGIKAEDNEPIKVVPQGGAGKEKTNTSI